MISADVGIEFRRWNIICQELTICDPLRTRQETIGAIMRRASEFTEERIELVSQIGLLVCFCFLRINLLIIFIFLRLCFLIYFFFWGIVYLAELSCLRIVAWR